MRPRIQQTVTQTTTVTWVITWEPDPAAVPNGAPPITPPQPSATQSARAIRPRRGRSLLLRQRYRRRTRHRPAS